MKAQDFTLPDQNGEMHTLSQYQGKKVILYFYPKDDTPGCTTEACNFQENLSKLTDKGVVVLGVSMDTPESHKQFAEKYHLNFTLLSDTEGEVIKEYEAWDEKEQSIIRTTYLIDENGEIIKVYEHVNPAQHIEEILKDLG